MKKRPSLTTLAFIIHFALKSDTFSFVRKMSWNARVWPYTHFYHIQSSNDGFQQKFWGRLLSQLEPVFVCQRAEWRVGGCRQATFWLRPYRTLVSPRESPDHVCRYLRPNGWFLQVIKTRKTKKKTRQPRTDTNILGANMSQNTGTVHQICRKNPS